MIGIYKITNKVNGKIYIGQSNDIKRRWSYYKNPPTTVEVNTLIMLALKKYGFNSFTFEVIEECEIDQLNEREEYWISYYNSYWEGYNMTSGWEHNVGEANPNAKLTEKDVILIRTLYDLKTPETKKEIYNRLFANKCSFRAFEKAWDWSTWAHIKREVYTEENKNFYKTTAKRRTWQNNANAKISDEEVMKIRDRYVNETTAEILKDYPQFTYSGLENILTWKTYNHLPIYKKREKKWINK